MSYPKGLPLHTIWDDIVFLVESTKDLLSLALACRTFKELIIPDHLTYRHIRCDIRRKELWRLLESRPRLARGIRSVELAEDSTLEDVRLPEAWGNSNFSYSYRSPITNENMTLLKNSISHMTSLREFTWTQFPESIHKVINISDVLTSSASRLEGLSIRAYLSPFRSSYLRFEKLSVWTLTSLKKVVIHNPNQAAIRMVLSCPDIEDLCLWDLPSGCASHLMQNANWKRLRRLSLGTDEIPISTEDLSMWGVQDKLIKSFLQCLKLTHIFCHFPVTEVDYTSLKWESLGDLCERLSSVRTLTYLEVDLVREITNVKLTRDENGKYTGYQSVSLKEAGGQPQSWTDIFLDLNPQRYS
ncbi:hypothetical protein Clacol_007032 [Clathrus columnatus]|uniref:F-box domain-containing protein n=1 Tax=Clathrus columnatus TaxID=1419009 RepID=A0AAV5AGE3_9AGAM|nr:hypothetical protein Clacol_007032 [Clathrus columnatus]